MSERTFWLIPDGVLCRISGAAIRIVLGEICGKLPGRIPGIILGSFLRRFLKSIAEGIFKRFPGWILQRIPRGIFGNVHGGISASTLDWPRSGDSLNAFSACILLEIPERIIGIVPYLLSLEQFLKSWMCPCKKSWRSFIKKVKLRRIMKELFEESLQNLLICTINPWKSLEIFWKLSQDEFLN